jgi:hypothetical protein
LEELRGPKKDALVGFLAPVQMVTLAFLSSPNSARLATKQLDQTTWYGEVKPSNPHALRNNNAD